MNYASALRLSDQSIDTRSWHNTHSENATETVINPNKRIFGAHRPCLKEPIDTPDSYCESEHREEAISTPTLEAVAIKMDCDRKLSLVKLLHRSLSNSSLLNNNNHFNIDDTVNNKRHSKNNNINTTSNKQKGYGVDDLDIEEDDGYCGDTSGTDTEDTILEIDYPGLFNFELTHEKSNEAKGQNNGHHLTTKILPLVSHKDSSRRKCAQCGLETVPEVFVTNIAGRSNDEIERLDQKANYRRRWSSEWMVELPFSSLGISTRRSAEIRRRACNNPLESKENGIQIPCSNNSYNKNSIASSPRQQQKRYQRQTASPLSRAMPGALYEERLVYILAKQYQMLPKNIEETVKNKWFRLPFMAEFKRHIVSTGLSIPDKILAVTILSMSKCNQIQKYFQPQEQDSFCFHVRGKRLGYDAGDFIGGEEYNEGEEQGDHDDSDDESVDDWLADNLLLYAHRNID